MKKKLISALLLFALLAGVLSGCETEQYTKKERASLEEKGRPMIEAALAEAFPSSKLLSVEAYKLFLLGQPSKEYLTEYITGEYEDADGVWRYYLNTGTGEAFTDKYFTELARKAVLEMLALPGDGVEFTEFLSEGIMLPHTPQEVENLIVGCWRVNALPFGVADARSFVEYASESPVRIMSCHLTVPGEIDISAYRYDDVFSTEMGIDFAQLGVSSAVQSFGAMRGEHASVSVSEEAALEDCIVRYYRYHRREEPDDEGHGRVVAESTLSASDITVERTSGGYRFHFPALDDEFQYVRIYAAEGMEIRNHDYTLRYDGEDREYETEWWEREDGRRRLGSAKTEVMRAMSATLTIRSDGTTV